MTFPIWAHLFFYHSLPFICAFLGMAIPFYLNMSDIWHLSSDAEHLTFFAVLIVGTVLGAVVPRPLMRRIAASCPKCGAGAYTTGRADHQSHRYRCSKCGAEHLNHVNFVAVFFGLVFTMVGIMIMLLPLFVGPDDINGPAWLGVVIGGPFLMIGLYITGIWGVIFKLLSRKYAVMDRIDWHSFFGAAVPMLVGFVLILISICDPRDEAFQSGRAPVGAAGVTFLLAGVAIIVPKFVTGKTYLLLGSIVAAMLLTAFAAVPALMVLDDDPVPRLVSVGVVGMFATLAWVYVVRKFINPKKWFYCLIGFLVLGVVALALASKYLPQEEPVANLVVPASREFRGQAEIEPIDHMRVSMDLAASSLSMTEIPLVTFNQALPQRVGIKYWLKATPRHEPQRGWKVWKNVEPGIGKTELIPMDEAGEYDLCLYSSHSSAPDGKVCCTSMTVVKADLGVVETPP